MLTYSGRVTHAKIDLPEKISSGVGAGIRKGLIEMVAHAVQNCSWHDTGATRASIYAAGFGMDDTAAATREVVSRGRERAEIEPIGELQGKFAVATNYAWYLELGWGAKRNTTRMSQRGAIWDPVKFEYRDRPVAQRIRDRAYVTYIQARPFMGPAFAKVAPHIPEFIKEEVQRELR